MAAGHSLIVEVDAAIRRGSGRRRAETLRRITDLFLGQSGRFSAEQVALFDDVMSRLIEHIESEALVELGRRLAPAADAPAQVIRKLARNDAIAVAGPVLVTSPRLGEPDLVDVARSKGQAHLLAISRRRQLGPAVTDVLVTRGNPYVKRNVAANPAARFSDAAYGTLVASAKQDGTLAERIVRRADVPPDRFRVLVSQATEAVRARLLAAAQPERRAEIRRVLDKVAGEIAEDAGRDYAAAAEKLLAQYPGGKLAERDVAQLAAAREFAPIVAALALMASVPAKLVEKLMTGARLEPVLILCKATRFKWPTVRAVIHARPAPKPSPEALTEACDDFNRLSLASAQHLLQYWQARESAIGSQ